MSRSQQNSRASGRLWRLYGVVVLALPSCSTITIREVPDASDHRDQDPAPESATSGDAGATRTDAASTCTPACREGEICVGRSCIATCRTNADCTALGCCLFPAPGLESTVPRLGICAAAPTVGAACLCETSADCPGSEICTPKGTSAEGPRAGGFFTCQPNDGTPYRGCSGLSGPGPCTPGYDCVQDCKGRRYCAQAGTTNCDGDGSGTWCSIPYRRRRA